jgi:tetratricopeptide (TPR) repeat protein
MLDRLYDQLRTAPDEVTADALNQQIWRLWVVPSDPDLAGKMSAVLAMEQAGELTRAMASLSQMVIQYPSYAEAWNQRATVEYQLNDYDASLADIDQVLSLEPKHYGALSGRVLVYLAEGNRPMALKAMIAALAVDPFLAERALFPELNQPQTEI